MNFIVKWFIERRIKEMLNKLFAALAGYKTHSLVVVGILVALLGHFYGPLDIGTLKIPQFSWEEVFKIIWNGGLFSALRSGVNLPK